jgi:hypothetical protein
MGAKVSAAQAARLADRNERIVRGWIASGKLKATKDGHTWMVDTDDLARIPGVHLQPQEPEDKLPSLESMLLEHDNQIAELKRRIIALEGRIIRPSPTTYATPAPLQSRTEAFSQPMESSADIASMGMAPRIAGALLKSDAARLVANRHGVAFNTAKGWPWPPSALASEEAAMRWALDYVARNPRQHPAGWRARCTVAGCPCHDERL